MLAKMGYKAGDSLGKSNSGIVEPIPVEVKIDRGGLGETFFQIFKLHLMAYNLTWQYKSKIT